MNRRILLLGLFGLASLPAAANERARRASPAQRGASTSQSRPGVAERANRRVGRAAESNTADKVRSRATRADDAMNRLVGRKGR